MKEFRHFDRKFNIERLTNYRRERQSWSGDCERPRFVDPRHQENTRSFLEEIEDVIEPLTDESEQDILAAEQKPLKESLLQKLLFFATENRLEQLARNVLYALPVASQHRPGGTHYDSFTYNFAPSTEAFERERLPQLAAFAQPGAPVHLITVDTSKLKDGIAQLLDAFNAKTIGKITEHYGGLPYTFFNTGITMVVEPSVSIKTYRIGDREGTRT